MEVDHLSLLNPQALPLDSCYLLDMDFSITQNSSLFEHSYWILAMKAAICDCQLVCQQTAHHNLPTRNTTTTRCQTHNIAIGKLSQIGTQSQRSWLPRTQEHNATITGTREMLAAIELDWPTEPLPSCRRPHQSSVFLAYRDFKRWQPD